MFALIQDGTPVPADSGLELLGRLPEPKSLLLLGRRDHTFEAFPICAEHQSESARTAPERRISCVNSSTSRDLRAFDVHLSYHDLREQARLVAEGKIDVAAFVMQENAELLRTLIRQYSLDIVAPQDIQGIVARYPWLSLGQIPVARYELIPPIPSVEKQIARLATLVVASRCTPRADRIAVLMLLGAELPGFVRSNPPSSTAAVTVLPLARKTINSSSPGSLRSPIDTSLGW